jgi:hypothetical protein
VLPCSAFNEYFTGAGLPPFWRCLVRSCSDPAKKMSHMVKDGCGCCSICHLPRFNPRPPPRRGGAAPKCTRRRRPDVSIRADFAILKWPTSAVCFGPPWVERTSSLDLSKELGSEGGSWTGEPKWTCTSRSGGSSSLAQARS